AINCVAWNARRRSATANAYLAQHVFFFRKKTHFEASRLRCAASVEEACRGAGSGSTVGMVLLLLLLLLLILDRLFRPRVPVVHGVQPPVPLLQLHPVPVGRQSLGAIEPVGIPLSQRIRHVRYATVHVLLGRLADAVPHRLQHDADAPIERRQMRFPQHGRDRIHRQRFAHRLGQRPRTVVEAQQRLERGRPYQAALQHWRQDGQLVVERFAEPAPMIQMDRERVVAEDFERFVVVPVHVAGEEVEHGHIHQVEQPAPLVVRRYVAHHRAVVGVGFPLRLPALVVRAAPRMPPHLALRIVLRGQEGGERTLERVRIAADRVRRVAVVRALAVKAQIAARRDEERLEQHLIPHLVDLGGDVEDAAGHGHRPPEAEQPVEMERRYLGRVPLVVGKVEVVRQGLLFAREAHRLEQGVHLVRVVDDQLQLGAALLLHHVQDRQPHHVVDDRVHERVVPPVQLPLGDAQLEALQVGGVRAGPQIEQLAERRVRLVIVERLVRVRFLAHDDTLERLRRPVLARAGRYDQRGQILEAIVRRRYGGGDGRLARIARPGCVGVAAMLGLLRVRRQVLLRAGRVAFGEILPVELVVDAGPVRLVRVPDAGVRGYELAARNPQIHLQVDDEQQGEEDEQGAEPEREPFAQLLRPDPGCATITRTFACAGSWHSIGDQFDRVLIAPIGQPLVAGGVNGNPWGSERTVLHCR
uniref:Uncharacterized protein n=1 Tax=Anopheles quadriannulatus TaxID=34691 RepID=A0A182XTA4_ANOQN